MIKLNLKLKMKSSSDATTEVKEDKITVGLRTMREYYRSHFLKYLKSINTTKTLIIEPSLMNIVVDILTREDKVPDNAKVIGIAELVGDKVSSCQEVSLKGL